MRKLLPTLLLMALVGASQARAQDGVVDPKQLLPLLMKVVTYDRNFAARSSGEFVVLVAAEDGKTPSVDITSLAKSMKLVTVSDRPLKFVSTTFKDQASLDAAIQSSNAKAVLAAPGTSANGVRDISEVAQDNQIYTMSIESEPMKTLAIGVVDKDGKPQIVINLAASKAIGAVFESSVLKLARVVQ